MIIVLAVIGGLTLVLAGVQVASMVGRVVIATAYQAFCSLREDVSETWFKHQQWKQGYIGRRDAFLRQSRIQAESQVEPDAGSWEQYQHLKS